ncbi:MAG: glycoside hydrolase family 9 protein [Saprospiraceae bacterium]
MLRFLPCCLLLFFAASLLAQEPSPYLHLDQFGYRPAAEKVAVLSNPQVGQNAAGNFTPGATLEVRRVSDNGVAWSGAPTIWNNGATHSESGDKGWWLDFSALTTPGNYYLIDPAGGQRTGTFTIADNVYAGVMKDAGRAFYYNRCNQPKPAPYAEGAWTDGASFVGPLQDTDCSFVNDRENAGLRRNLSGGWFDAGDYNKYVTFAQSAVQPLLWAYVESPVAFTDNWNIPESGNGIPDILDEVKWEIDWVRKMINPDGSVIIKMGSINYQNAASPPSSNTARRYYGPTCTSASIATAAMLAQAATVFRGFPALSAYADAIEAEAESTFAYWLTRRNANTLEYDCDDGTINAGDADRDEQDQKEIALTAAVHPFEATGKAVYNNYVRDHINEAEYVMTGWWGPYKNEFTTAMVHYQFLPGADAATVGILRNSMTGIVQNLGGDFYGFNPADLYRAFMPEWSYHWGSNSVVSNYGALNRIMARADLVAGAGPDLNRKADGMVHYLHGVNPLGFVYLSGMEGRGAERGIQEIYHGWFADGTPFDNSETSLYGPAPGFVSGGPNRDFSVTSISPPAGEPAMKSYKDWNADWPQASYEITEPAIYYQATYIRNLAAMMVQEIVLPVTYSSALSARIQAKTVLLEWGVSEEINAAYYAIQYLDDRDEWTEIGRVAARGESSYRFVHASPREGRNDYRLRQTDFDGTYALSTVASVNFTDPYAAIRVYPNPLPGGTALHLENLPVGTELRMYDSSGRQIRRRPVSGHQTTVSTVDLPAGVYRLEILRGREGAIWQEQIVVE